MKRSPAKHFQDLIVWQKAHQSVLSVLKQHEEVSKLFESYLCSLLNRYSERIPRCLWRG